MGDHVIGYRPSPWDPEKDKGRLVNAAGSDVNPSSPTYGSRKARSPLPSEANARRDQTPSGVVKVIIESDNSHNPEGEVTIHAIKGPVHKAEF
jgi:hypothetical protein